MLVKMLKIIWMVLYSLAWPDHFFRFFFLPPQIKTEKAVWPCETRCLSHNGNCFSIQRFIGAENYKRKKAAESNEVVEEASPPPTPPPPPNSRKRRSQTKAQTRQKKEKTTTDEDEDEEIQI